MCGSEIQLRTNTLHVNTLEQCRAKHRRRCRLESTYKNEFASILCSTSSLLIQFSWCVSSNLYVMVASTSFALFLSSFLPLVHGHVAKKPAPHRNASYGDSLVVSEAPDYVRPYILPNLEGEQQPSSHCILPLPADPYSGKKVQLATDVFRMLVTNASSGGAFSLLGTNGVHGLVVPEHYHSEYYETFFCVKGALNVWVDDQVRRLTAQDFGAVKAPSIRSKFQPRQASRF